MRITFEDSDGKHAIVSMSFTNPPLRVVSKESREKYNSTKYDHWVECDDDIMEIRLFNSIRWNTDDGEARVEVGDTNMTNYLYLHQLKKFAYDGVKDNQKEVEITNLAWNQDPGLSKKVYAIVDIPHQRVYALKFDFKSSTSSVIDYYLIPKFPHPK